MSFRFKDEHINGLKEELRSMQNLLLLLLAMLCAMAVLSTTIFITFLIFSNNQ
jgi:hypothetical protein